MASAVDLVSLTGSATSVDETGISWEDEETDDSDTGDEPETSDSEPTATPKRYGSTDFEVTSHNGPFHVPTNPTTAL